MSSFFNLPVFSFLRNGQQVPVQKDTVNPANTNPLPVELTGVNGDVSVNAANLNIEVQTSAYGANPDSVRISDGVDELAINPDGSINVSPATPDTVSSPVIAMLTMASADTEYSYTFPADAKQFFIKARIDATLKLAYVSGQTTGNYTTVYAGTSYDRKRISRTTSLTVYFSSSKPSTVLELEHWT